MWSNFRNKKMSRKTRNNKKDAGIARIIKIITRKQKRIESS